MLRALDIHIPVAAMLARNSQQADISISGETSRSDLQLVALINSSRRKQLNLVYTKYIFLFIASDGSNFTDVLEMEEHLSV